MAEATQVRTVLAGLADLVLPPRCGACGTLVNDHGALCASCWANVTFIQDPLCQDCGIPFDLAVEGVVQCASCMAKTPSFAPLRAAVVYDDGARPIILKFKHGDATYCAPLLASWMHRAGAELFDGADWLIPVPLHRWRLFTRRYNQAALLANQLTGLTGVPTAGLALCRIKATKSQGHLSKADRKRNVAGAFDIHPKWKERLAGKRVVLIDDVSTTGATLAACATALKKGGVDTICSVTVARAIAT